MARNQKYAWLTAKTRWGTVRIGVPLSSYRKATARGRDDKLFPDGDRFRDFICVRVRRRLNSAGGQVQFVRWSDITISDVATSSDPAAETESVSLTPQHLLFEAQVAAVVDSISEPSEDEIAVAQELFPELFYAPNPSTTDADCVCGCVPFPVTML